MAVIIIDIAIDIQLYQAKLAEAIKQFDIERIQEVKTLLFRELDNMEAMINKIKGGVN
ncbi:hypothetical protein [Parvicella tangerina]|uniref:hypothetical protein n=1 Tax=Parvicella tangerina TaxID=2829795 RepID=UPI00215C8152|nr:hypothetical protein [Parvicella tangerina]